MSELRRPVLTKQQIQVIQHLLTGKNIEQAMSLAGYAPQSIRNAKFMFFDREAVKRLATDFTLLKPKYER
jgi:hypothetical protein